MPQQPDENVLNSTDDRATAKLSAGPRPYWDSSFEKMAAAGDDQLLDGDELLSTEWDEDEWQW